MIQPLLLIDADVLAYQAAAGAEKILCFDGDACFPCCSLADAQAAFEGKLKNLLETLDTPNFILAFSDSSANNFRRKLFPAYKMNREGKPRPVALAPLRAALMRDYRTHTYLRPSLEADDCLGILATQHNFHCGAKKIIVSIDKDLKSIPGYFYNLGKPEEGVQSVSEEEADHWHMMQSLMGDSTDGYPGCPKIGPVAAQKLLATVPHIYADMWPIVLAAYAKAGFGAEYALTQARVARILRISDYNIRERKVKLWRP